MNYTKIIIIFITTSFLIGCSANTAKTLKYAQDSYYGKKIDDLVVNIGLPQNKYKMENGDVLYKWIYSATAVMPSTTIYNGTSTVYGAGNTATAYGSGTATTVGGGVSNRVCEMTVLANSSNIIKSIKFNRDTFGTEAFTVSMCSQMFGIN